MLSVKGKRVRLGIRAPKDVVVDREKVRKCMTAYNMKPPQRSIQHRKVRCEALVRGESAARG